MKKTMSIIALCLVIILSIPAVPALASGNDGYVLYLTNSGNNYSGDLKIVADALYYGSSSIDNSSNSIVNSANYINGLGLDDYIVLSYDSGFDGSGFSDYQIGLCSFNGISDGKMYAVQLSYGTCRHVLVTSSTPFTADFRSLNLDNYSLGNVTTVNSGSVVGSSTIYCVLLNYYNGYFNESMPSGITNNMSNSNMVDIRESNNACFIRYSSLPIYSIFENSAIGLRGHDNTYFYYSDYVSHLFDDFEYTCINETVNALTTDGVQNGYNTDVIGPQVVYESNENHMYLKSCDVGFCKPYSTSDLSSAGGGYLYVNYTYDNWINSHSSDYWVNIRTVVNVDGTQFSGINTRALDLNGVNVLTFKESTVPNNWTDEGLLFVEFPNTVVSTYKAGYVYSIPYPTFANTDSGGISNRSRFLSNGRNRLFLTPSGGRGYDITNESLGDFLQSIFNVNVHQKFTLTVTVWLQDTNNNRSGEFTKTFNLITGVGTTTDTGITDNDNPFEPDPMLPDVPDGSGNDSNSVAPIVNNFMINGSGTIGYDPGYRDLKEDIDKDPDGNFSQYLDPMHNDDVGSWFMSFVEEMPTEMKSILIAGVGVGVLFGLYRFIRRG